MELVELIRGAQDAMDRGDYAFAAAACSHAIDTYPSCFSAHRMLAEAYLEQGLTDAAIQHFERTLSIDPLNVLARLGLGVAAEEKREMSDAYAAYLHAWEINPALDQVRDELVRLRGLLGGGERLHPTRAGLAGIFARGGQFGRAAAEWRAVLMVEPENRRARTSLAEVLWRSGDDLPASTMCRDALKEFPENARALAMLAEVEQRKGSPAAAELIERYQAVDPLAEIATLLSEWRDGTDVSFLHCESASLPDFDPSTATMPEPVAVVAPASAPSSLASGHFAAPDLWDTLVRDFSDDPQAPGGSGHAAAEVQPFSWLDEGNSTPPPVVEPFSLDALIEQHKAAPADLPMEFMQHNRGPSTDQLSLEDEIAAFEPADTTFAPPAAPPDQPASFAPDPVPAVAPAPLPNVGSAIAQPRAGDQFVTADGRVDLTVGWDDLDRQLREATPNFDNAAEMDALAAQLGVTGIAPFEMGAAPFDETAWSPFTADDLTEPAAAHQAQPADPAPTLFVPPAALPATPGYAEDPIPNVPALAEDESFDLGWDLDEELVSAIPAPQSSGYTEMLRHVDTELPQEIDFGPNIDPFANPDSAGSPLGFEDLLAVTSRDGTAPLHAPAGLEREVPAPARFDDLSALQELVNADFNAPDLPLNESPLGLEELLRGSGVAEDHDALVWEPVAEADIGLDAAWQSASESSEPVLGELDALGFEAELDGLGDLVPFSLDDAEGVAAGDEPEIDFSDINDAPFDPRAIAHVVAPLAAPGPQPVVAEPWTAGVESVEQVAIGDEAIDTAWEAAALGEAEDSEQAFPAAVAAQRRDAGGFGVPPSGVAWPAFVNHTSELIDRSLAGGNLFARLREAKRSASSAGLLHVDRSVRDLRRPANAIPPDGAHVQVFSVPVAELVSPPLNGAARHGTMTESERIDLMAMRVQLIEDASSAGDVADRLEGAVMHGLNDPLALRVLGEAYLKLGRTEQAAAQFRQAMLARHRSR